jgi:hypothetical protein
MLIKVLPDAIINPHQNPLYQRAGADYAWDATAFESGRLSSPNLAGPSPSLGKSKPMALRLTIGFSVKVESGVSPDNNGSSRRSCMMPPVHD